MTMWWNEVVHEQAGIQNQQKADRIYYKLPEHLEHHHKQWLQVWGTNATLVNSAEEWKEIQKIFLALLVDLKFCLQLNFQCWLLHRIKFPVSIKGKEKELLPAPTPVWMSASPSIQPGSHNLNIQHPKGSFKAMSQQAASKVKKAKHCANCRDAKCPLADMCKGRGNRAWCTCTGHSQHKNPRAKTS
jgi:hypothetical protein